MGLDQSLYLTTKRRKEAIEKFHGLRVQYMERVAKAENSKRAKTLFASLNKQDGFPNFDFEKLPDSLKNEIEFFKTKFRRIAKAVGIRIDEDFNPEFNPSDYGLTENDNLIELAYWRKEWGLHNYIESYYGDPKNDNLVEVWLDREAIENIIKARYFKNVFRRALKRIDDTHVIFYFPWY